MNFTMHLTLEQLSGIRIIESVAFKVQYRFPRSKSRRIRKKWQNNPRNYKPDPKLYSTHHNGQITSIMGHPQIIQHLREQIIPQSR